MSMSYVAFGPTACRPIRPNGCDKSIAIGVSLAYVLYVDIVVNVLGGGAEQLLVFRFTEGSVFEPLMDGFCVHHARCCYARAY